MITTHLVILSFLNGATATVEETPQVGLVFRQASGNPFTMNFYASSGDTIRGRSSSKGPFSVS